MSETGKTFWYIYVFDINHGKNKVERRILAKNMKDGQGKNGGGEEDTERGMQKFQNRDKKIQNGDTTWLSFQD